MQNGFLKVPELPQHDRQTSPGVSPGYQQSHANPDTFGANVYGAVGHLSEGLGKLADDVAQADMTADLNELDKRNIEWQNQQQEKRGGLGRTTVEDYNSHFENTVAELGLANKYSGKYQAALNERLGRRYNTGLNWSMGWQSKQTRAFEEEQLDLAWKNHLQKINGQSFSPEQQDESLQAVINQMQTLFPERDPEAIRAGIIDKERVERVLANINDEDYALAEQQLSSFKAEMSAQQYHALNSKLEAAKNKNLQETKLAMSATDGIWESNLQSIMETGTPVQGARANVALREQLGMVPDGSAEEYGESEQAAYRYYQAVNSEEALNIPWDERYQRLVDEFAAEAGSPQYSQDRKIWDTIHGEYLKQRAAYEKDPVAYNQAVVEQAMQKPEVTAGFAGLEGEDLAIAQEQARVGLNLELQRRQGGESMAPHLFSQAQVANWKAQYAQANPDAKAAMLGSLNHTYGELAGNAMAELGISYDSIVAGKLMANPASQTAAGILLQYENSNVTALLAGNADAKAADVGRSVQNALYNSGFGKALLAATTQAVNDTGARDLLVAVDSSVQKLTAYYVSAGDELSTATDKAVSAFAQSWGGAVDNHMAVLIPANINAGKVQMGLTAASASWSDYSGHLNGMWRNMGGNDVGLWNPEIGAWMATQDGQPARLSLEDAEALGAMVQNRMQYDAHVGQEYINYDDTERMIGRNSAELRAIVLEMVNRPSDAPLTNKYRDMQFKPVRAGVREGATGGRSGYAVQGNWSTNIQRQHPDVYNEIETVSQEMGVPFPLALSVAMQESGGNMTPPGHNDGGKAVGVYQAHAAAAIDMGFEPSDRGNMGSNVKIGIGYLAKQYEEFGDWQKALIAYNWGPENVRKWLRGEIDIPPIRLKYASDVMKRIAGGNS